MKTPFVAQLGDVDCGPACLTAVLAAYGIHRRVGEVSRACGNGRDGTTGAALVRGARALGLTARPIRLAAGPQRLQALQSAGLPAVLLLRGHHYVVAESVGGRGLLINDPAQGHRRLDDAELAEEWPGLAILLAPGPGLLAGGASGQPATGPLRSWWRGEDHGSRLLTVLGGLAAALASLAALAAVLAVRGVGAGVAAAVGGGSRLLAILAVLTWLAGWASAHLRSKLLHRTVTRRSLVLVRHLLRLSPSFLQYRFSGEVAMRPQRIDGAAMQIVTLFVDGAIGVLTVTAALVGIALSSVVAAVAVLAALAAVAWLIGHGLEDYQEAQRRAMAQQQRRDGEIVATLTAVETLKSEASPAQLLRRWTSAQREVGTLQRRAHLIMLRRTRGSVLVDAAATCAVLWIGHQDRIPAANALVLVLLSGIALSAGRRVISLGIFDLTQVETALRMVEDVLIEPVTDGLPAGKASRSLELRDLSFTQPGSTTPLFQRVDLRIEPGNVCFVIGDSGVGKSSLARVAIGALPARSGTIARPAQVGYVPQRSMFTEGTVAENLSFGAQFDPEELWTALAMVRLAETIAARGGPGATVTQNARNFSGGERQRLALARALLRRPELLVLDEAFSAMDDELTDQLHDVVRELGIPVLSIAHHLPSLRPGDTVRRLTSHGLELVIDLPAGADSDTARTEDTATTELELAS